MDTANGYPGNQNTDQMPPTDGESMSALHQAMDGFFDCPDMQPWRNPYDAHSGDTYQATHQVVDGVGPGAVVTKVSRDRVRITIQHAGQVLDIRPTSDAAGDVGELHQVRSFAVAWHPYGSPAKHRATLTVGENGLTHMTFPEDMPGEEVQDVTSLFAAGESVFRPSDEMIKRNTSPLDGAVSDILETMTRLGGNDATLTANPNARVQKDDRGGVRNVVLESHGIHITRYRGDMVVEFAGPDGRRNRVDFTVGNGSVHAQFMVAYNESSSIMTTVAERDFRKLPHRVDGIRYWSDSPADSQSNALTQLAKNLANVAVAVTDREDVAGQEQAAQPPETAPADSKPHGELSAEQPEPVATPNAKLGERRVTIRTNGERWEVAELTDDGSAKYDEWTAGQLPFYDEHALREHSDDPGVREMLPLGAPHVLPSDVRRHHAGRLCYAIYNAMFLGEWPVIDQESGARQFRYRFDPADPDRIPSSTWEAALALASEAETIYGLRVGENLSTMVGLTLAKLPEDHPLKVATTREFNRLMAGGKPGLRPEVNDDLDRLIDQAFKPGAVIDEYMRQLKLGQQIGRRLFGEDSHMIVLPRDLDYALESMAYNLFRQENKHTDDLIPEGIVQQLALLIERRALDAIPTPETVSRLQNQAWAERGPGLTTLSRDEIATLNASPAFTKSGFHEDSFRGVQVVSRRGPDGFVQYGVGSPKAPNRLRFILHGIPGIRRIPGLWPSRDDGAALRELSALTASKRNQATQAVDGGVGQSILDNILRRSGLSDESETAVNGLYEVTEFMRARDAYLRHRASLLASLTSNTPRVA